MMLPLAELANEETLNAILGCALLQVLDVLSINKAPLDPLGKPCLAGPLFHLAA